MKAQHDQNLDIFGDFFPQSSKKYFFIRTEVNQTVCLYKVDPCGKVLYLVPRSVHGITVCLMYFNPWPAA